MNTGEILHEFIHRAGYNYAVAGSVDGAVACWKTRRSTFRRVDPRGTAARRMPGESHQIPDMIRATGSGVAGLGGDYVLRVWDVDTGEVAEVEDCQPSGFNVF